jgi:hypothetical protein
VVCTALHFMTLKPKIVNWAIIQPR